MDKTKVTAVVVTYNRLSLLKKCIEALRNQSIQLNKIIVINNSSSDGTLEWLQEQTDLLICTQDNIGGAGGFHKGIKEALNWENDWVWCMDDDVYPELNALENLLSSKEAGSPSILCPKRKIAGKTITGEVIKFNLSNPFKRHKEIVLNSSHNNKSATRIEGMAFEGPLIHREIINSIGLPNKDFFIFYDDTEYSYRAILAGYPIYYIPNAILRKEFFPKKGGRDWKFPYQLRNEIYFVHKYGKNSFFRNAYPLRILLTYSLGYIRNTVIRSKKYKLIDIFLIIKCYQNGVKGKFGIIEQ